MKYTLWILLLICISLSVSATDIILPDDNHGNVCHGFSDCSMDGQTYISTGATTDWGAGPNGHGFDFQGGQFCTEDGANPGTCGRNMNGDPSVFSSFCSSNDCGFFVYFAGDGTGTYAPFVIEMETSATMGGAVLTQFEFSPEGVQMMTSGASDNGAQSISCQPSTFTNEPGWYSFIFLESNDTVELWYNQTKYATCSVADQLISSLVPQFRDTNSNFMQIIFSGDKMADFAMEDLTAPVNLFMVAPPTPPSFNQTYQNSTRPNGTYSFTGNWSATNPALGTSNDSRWTVVTSNTTKTTTNAWTVPGFNGVVYTQWTINNSDGTSVQYTKHTFTQTNSSTPPSFNQTFQNTTRANGTYSFVANWSGTNNAFLSANVNSWSIVSNNATKTATITWNNQSFNGAVTTLWTLTNADGTANVVSRHTFTQTNYSVAPTFNETLINSTYNYSLISFVSTINWTGTNNATVSVNDSQITIVTLNTTKTATVNFTPTRTGQNYFSFTVSNSDGSATQLVRYFVNDTSVVTVFVPANGCGGDANCQHMASTGAAVGVFLLNVKDPLVGFLTALAFLSIFMFVGLSVGVIIYTGFKRFGKKEK